MYALASKIKGEHLERRALIYVRQSTLAQVRENTGSQMRQYDLEGKALEMGWAKDQIEIVDQDQGRSGASAEGRDGFQQLVAEVGMGQAGAVFSLEASRLARSCIDWYRLLEICGLMKTLVVDEEGVYDPSQHNDRLLLGFKGTMSEAELHWLHSRLMGGRMKKAESGELRIPLPTGLVYDEGERIVLDPDEEVQRAIQMLFEVFQETGTAMGVVRYYRDHRLSFPDTREQRGPEKGQVTWKRLGRRRVLNVLHNPLYAGAYAYGRTEQRVRAAKPGEIRPVKKVVHHGDPQKWKVLRVDAHAGYLSWEDFLRNLKQLDDNRSDRKGKCRGAVRKGQALLQGIVICGKCGSRMTIRYVEGGKPVYRCQLANMEYGEPTCQTIQGSQVDVSVAELFLAAMTPAELSVSLATLEQVEARTQQIEQQRELKLERARYEADLARRRYCAVDPDNRLVARNLELDWNAKLANVERLQRENAIATHSSRLVAGPKERSRILALASDMGTIWEADTTTNAERKQLLRYLIQDVSLTQGKDSTHIGLRWQTGARSELEVPRPKGIAETRRTSPIVIRRIRAMIATQTDSQIAWELNEEGLRTGAGKRFTRERVRRVRVKYKLSTGCPEMPGILLDGKRGDGRFSTRATAELLNVSIATIGNWCRSGKLDSVQVIPGAPRWIKLTPDLIVKLRKSKQQTPKP
jgi:DNA invertase Pin-like site-specific DNA recombinase